MKRDRDNSLYKLIMTERGTFTFDKWLFEISESHILKSEGEERERFVELFISDTDTVILLSH